jgi:hypothetical protein
LPLYFAQFTEKSPALININKLTQILDKKVDVAESGLNILF